jgi:hypothetical protein
MPGETGFSSKALRFYPSMCAIRAMGTNRTNDVKRMYVFGKIVENFIFIFYQLQPKLGKNNMLACAHIVAKDLLLN